MVGGRATQSELTAQIRRRLSAHLITDTDATPQGVAIYSLCDPREVRRIRYVGQTTAPRRRLLQHVNTARLWLPDEMPWWIASPKLRPLYQWIRELYRDEGRLPVMVVSAWVATIREARVAERAQILEHLSNGITLLNVESEILGRQMPLPFLAVRRN